VTSVCALSRSASARLSCRNAQDEVDAFEFAAPALGFGADAASEEGRSRSLRAGRAFSVYAQHEAAEAGHLAMLVEPQAASVTCSSAA
jgi:hypothetical protein